MNFCGGKSFIFYWQSLSVWPTINYDERERCDGPWRRRFTGVICPLGDGWWSSWLNDFDGWQSCVDPVREIPPSKAAGWPGIPPWLSVLRLGSSHGPPILGFVGLASPRKSNKSMKLHFIWNYFLARRDLSLNKVWGLTHGLTAGLTKPGDTQK